LEKQWDQIYIGTVKLHVNIPKFGRRNITDEKAKEMRRSERENSRTKERDKDVEGSPESRLQNRGV